MVVREFWRLMATNDFFSVSDVLAPSFVLEWPQSNERIHGPKNFAQMNTEYPSQGSWTFTINELVASESEAVTHVSVTDGTIRGDAVSFFTVKEGLIVKIVEFWPEPYTPPPNRSHLTELIT